MNREIPGFYFDPEKRKYFKIQANHVAPPGSQYSNESIKRKRVEVQRHEKRVQLDKRLSKERVSISAILRHPLIGAGREIGAQLSSTVRQDQQAQVYASQLQRLELYNFSKWPTDVVIRAMLRDPSTGTLVVGGQRGTNSNVKLCFPDPSHDSEARRTYSTESYYWTGDPYRLSSLSLSRTGYLLTTMDSGPNGDSCLAPSRIPSVSEAQSHGARDVRPFGFHPTRLRTECSLWCSEAAPVEDKALFAVGTSDGLFTLEGYGSHWTLSQKSVRKFTRLPATGDILRYGDSPHASVNAVEWLSSSLIACGMRSSAILLHDLRSNDSAFRLQHTHSVAKIRMVDEYRLVAGGYKSLQMYDIRFTPNGLQHRPNPNSPNHTSTRPYLTFQDFTPDVIPDFDVSTELGLLASASDERKIQLFSLATGSQVSSHLTNYQYPEPITCIRFESTEKRSNEEGPQTPSLLVSARSTIDQWTW